uniref:NACHT domain-containing protein n=1 Tax=uncultured Dysgonomonas sp. TaxID=206096 RepID=UPI00258AA211|nr:NACHT domain-containing protein [uncultured Dysgonomonas sp.]
MGLNWNYFQTKFNGKEQAEFESLSYHLFCSEYNNRVGLFGYKNQAGIEKDPLQINDEYISFQAKFYSHSLSKKKADIIDSIRKAKNKNPHLSKILFYINLEFPESSKKDRKDPKFKEEIESFAKKLNIKLDWRVPSHIEIQLYQLKNKHLHEYFFGTKKNNIDDIPYNYFIKDIEIVEYFIHRQLSNKEGEIYKTNNDCIPSLSAYQLLIKYKHSIIVANAGIGKTTLLKQIARKVADEKFYYPIYISLNTYTVEDCLADFVKREYEDLNDFIELIKDKLFFIIDGFDEICKSGEGIKRVKEFISHFRTSHIVLSTRSSHYTNEFIDIERLDLYEITDNDIYGYIKYYYPDVECSKFVLEARIKGLHEILYNPFYLNLLIKSYKKNHTLSSSLTEIINELVIERMKLDSEHFPIFQIAREYESIKLDIKKLALIMTLMSRKSILDTEFRTIFKESGLYEKLISATPLRKTSTKNTTNWTFDHNIFLECFAAETLLNIEDIKDLKNIVCYPNSEIIIPEWNEVIAHYVSLLDTDSELFSSFIEWLSIYNQNVIVRIEKEKLTVRQRDTIFIKIFSWYKEKKIWITSKNLSGRDLALFAESKQLIDYLINEATDKGNHRRVRLSSLIILSYYRFNYLSFKERILYTKRLIVLIQQIGLDDTSFIEDTIRVIKALDAKDSSILDQLMEIVEKSNSQHIRSAMYRLIINSELVDKYVGYFIKGIVIERKKAGTEGRDPVNLMGERQLIMEGLCMMKKEESYIEYFKYLNNRENKNYLHFRKDKEEFITILNNSISVCSQKIYFQILTLYNQSSHSLRDKHKDFITFFTKTNLREKAFKDTIDLMLEDTKYSHYSWNLPYLITDEYFPILLSYKDKIEYFLSLIQSIYYSLIEIDNLLAIRFKEYFINVGFVLKEKPNYLRIEEDRKQAAFDILFDRIRYKKECIDIINAFGKEYLTKEQIRNLSWDERGKLNQSVVMLLDSLVYEKEQINKQDILHYFSKENKDLDIDILWHIYDDLLDKSNNKDTPKISEIQKQFIKDWCDEYAEETDFTNISNGEGYKQPLFFFLFFMQHFGFKYSNEKLLDMLCVAIKGKEECFDNEGNEIIDEHISIDYIVSQLPLEIVHDRIILNIKNGLLPSYTLLLHIEYALRNSLIKSFQFILDILINLDFDRYYKSNIIHYWFEYKQDIPQILTIQSNLKDYSLKIVLAKLLVKEEYNNEAILIFKDVLNNAQTEEDRADAIEWLMILKQPEGIKHRILWIQKYKRSPISRWNREAYQYEDIDMLPYYMQLLEMTWDNDIETDDSMRSIILSDIVHLGSFSNENYKKVKDTLSTFINCNINIYDDVIFINHYIEDLITKYNKENYKPKGLKKAIEIVNEYLM